MYDKDSLKQYFNWSITYFEEKISSFNMFKENIQYYFKESLFSPCYET